MPKFVRVFSVLILANLVFAASQLPGQTSAQGPAILALPDSAASRLAWEAVLDYRSTRLPDTSTGSYIVMEERAGRTTWDRGLAILAAYPDDPRRWEWFISTTPYRRFFFAADSTEIRDAWNNGREASLPVDTVARNLWKQQFQVLRAAFLASPQVTDNNRRSFRYRELRASIWPQRVAIRRGELTEGRAYLDWYQHAMLGYMQDERSHSLTELLNGIMRSREFRSLGDSALLAFLEPFTEAKNTRLRLLARAKDQLIRNRDIPVDMQFAMLDGGHFDLASLRGKVVLVDFWNIGCSSCIASFPKFKELYQQYKDKGFEIVTVSTDPDENRERVVQLITKHELPWPQARVGGKDTDEVHANEYMRRYQIFGVPEMFLVDQRGFLIQNGYINGQELQSMLERLFPN